MRKYNNYSELSRPLGKENGHNNQPNTPRETDSNECGWRGEEGGIENNTTINSSGDYVVFIVLICDC